MDEMVAYFKNANVSDIDPAPMLRLMRYQKRKATLIQTLIQVKNSKDTLASITNLVDAIKPHAELTMLESKKYSKAAVNQTTQASSLTSGLHSLKSDATYLEREITGEYYKGQTTGAGCTKQDSNFRNHSSFEKLRARRTTPCQHQSRSRGGSSNIGNHQGEKLRRGRHPSSNRA
jgi:hypothetical protein